MEWIGGRVHAAHVGGGLLLAPTNINIISTLTWPNNSLKNAMKVRIFLM